ncbi:MULTISPECIES: hypothetical protein [unclassified Streptomyces]|uniref:hypothetical protein n=1 Tax=unclassified Streptomyces TaxID=2593676 RepID=UPI0033C9D9AC
MAVSWRRSVGRAIGVLAPLVATALVGAFGWPGAALLHLGAVVIGPVGILATKETWAVLSGSACSASSRRKPRSDRAGAPVGAVLPSSSEPR